MSFFVHEFFLFLFHSFPKQEKEKKRNLHQKTKKKNRGTCSKKELISTAVIGVHRVAGNLLLCIDDHGDDDDDGRAPGRRALIALHAAAFSSAAAKTKIDHFRFHRKKLDDFVCTDIVSRTICKTSHSILLDSDLS